MQFGYSMETAIIPDTRRRIVIRMNRSTAAAQHQQHERLQAVGVARPDGLVDHVARRRTQPLERLGGEREPDGGKPGAAR